MNAYEQIESILSDDVIKDMQLDVASWIDRNKLHGEFNKFWVNYDQFNSSTGYVLIDFAVYFMQNMVL